MITLPIGTQIYEALVSSPDGKIKISLFLAMTEEEHAYAMLHDIIPKDTNLVMAIIPAVDAYNAPSMLQ
jgi:hypothetical protein